MVESARTQLAGLYRQVVFAEAQKRQAIFWKVGDRDASSQRLDADRVADRYRHHLCFGCNFAAGSPSGEGESEASHLHQPTQAIGISDFDVCPRPR